MDEQQQRDESTRDPAEGKPRGAGDARRLRWGQLPRDDRHWVLRGIVGRRSNVGNESTARLHCLFQAVPSDTSPDAYDPYEDRNPTMRTLALNAGMLPLVRPNKVFLNGKHIGEMPSRTVSIRIDCSAEAVPVYRLARLVRAAEEPTVWFAVYPGYFEERRVNVQLPCSEIVRATMAPTSHFARALLSGPWGEARHKLVDVSECSVDPADAGHWRLGLRRGTGTEYAQLAGRMLFEPEARAVAEVLHANFLGEKGAFKVPLPIADKHLRLDVLVHPSAELTHVVRASAIRQICRSEHVPPRITGTKVFSGRSKGVAPQPFPQPESGTEVDPHDNNLEETQQDPPRGSSAHVAHFEGEPFPLDVFHSKVTLVRDIRGEGRGYPVGDSGAATAGSTGSHDGNEKGVGRISVDQPAPVSSSRFLSVLAMFQRLEAEGHVTQVATVDPPSDRFLDRDGVKCWPFTSTYVRTSDARVGGGKGRNKEPPDARQKVYTRHWAYLDQSIRTALAVQFHCLGTRFVWVEIDVREDADGVATENYSAIVLLVRGSVDSEVAEIVGALDVGKGRLATGTKDGRQIRGIMVWRVKHEYLDSRSVQIKHASMSRRLKAIAERAKGLDVS